MSATQTTTIRTLSRRNGGQVDAVPFRSVSTGLTRVELTCGNGKTFIVNSNGTYVPMAS